MPWDPSIIQSFKQYTGPDPDQTARTLSQIAMQGVQKQGAEASLAGLLDQQNQERAIRNAYMANATTPENIPQALMGIGAGTEAAGAAKTNQDNMRSQLEFAARALMNVKDQAGLDAARLAMHQAGIHGPYVDQIPQKYEDAAPQIKPFVNFALPAEKQAEMANKLEASKLVAGANVVPVTDENGNQFFAPKGGGAARPIVGPDGTQLKKPPKSAGGGAPGESSLDPDALEAEAQAYAMTHHMSSFGNGKAALADKHAVMKRAAQILKENGGDFTGNAANAAASAASLKKFQTQTDQMKAFEDTAISNLDLAMSLLDKIPDSGGALLNGPLRGVAAKMGNADLTAFNTALNSARTEIGKVLSGNSGNSGLTEGARTEMQHLMSDDLTAAQFRASAKVLRTDTANRLRASDDTLKAIKERLSGKKEGGGPAASSSGAKQVTAYRYNADHTQRKPMFSDGTEGPAEPVNGQ